MRRTDTEFRDRVPRLMLSNHPNACLVRDHRVDCEKYRPRPVISAMGQGKTAARSIHRYLTGEEPPGCP